MSIDLFDGIMSNWFSSTGDYTLIALGIMAFFVIVLVIAGLELKYSMMFTLPLAVAFSPEVGSGWLSPWVAGLYWVLVLGYGGFMLWNLIADR